MFKSWKPATKLILSCLLYSVGGLYSACGDDNASTPGVGSDAGNVVARVDGGADAAQPSATSDARAPDVSNPVSDASAPISDASAPVSDGGPRGVCDLSGIWIARMNTESLALGQSQFANNWYYFEFDQQGEALRVTRHLDCGIEVRGTVTVVLAPATTKALIAHNLQAGRKATVKVGTGGHCDLTMDRFWSVRGVSESKYAPADRFTQQSVMDLKGSLPLPLSTMPELTEDWDGDGHPGIAWNVTGIVSGTRHTVQRDWTQYFTADGYTINAGTDFGDLVIRAQFDSEEVVFEADLGLNQLSQPVAASEHTLTLRFLGRSHDDARAKALLGADDVTSCANVRQALPPVSGLR